MNIRCIFLIISLCGMVIQELSGQIIADFTFDDTSDLPASLMINRVGQDAVGVNPLARSDGEGVYTLIDPAQPEAHQNINLKIPENLLKQQKTIQLEFDFRPQENFVWFINAGFNLFRFGHHVINGGLHIRYATTANPGVLIESDYVGVVPEGERSIIIFSYNFELGRAYIIQDRKVLWETPEELRTPGEQIVWDTQDGHFYVGADMDGDGSTIPSLYRFRIYESLCLDISPPLTKNDTICQAGPARLQASGGQEGHYRWYQGPAENPSLIEGAVNSQYISETLHSSTSYYVAIEMGNCQTPLIPVEAIVQEKPAAPKVQQELPCGPGEATVYLEENNHSDGIEQYFWYSQEGELIRQSPDLLTASISFHIHKDTLIYVSSSNGLCESEKVPVEIQLIEAPIIDTGEDRRILKGESISLELSGEHIESIRWEEDESLQNPDSTTPLVSPEFTTTYRFSALNAEGCETTGVVRVHVVDKFPVPNAFSPNNDGKNDTWEIPHIENYPKCLVLIFNRWGNELYKSEGYLQPWDGTHRGNPLPAGTYYYTLKLNREQQPIKGTVLIIR